jgi:hypothetical protein
MMRILLVRAVPLVLIAALAACATGPRDGEPRQRHDINLLTRADLDELNVRNAYEAVERMRPEWLRPRTRSVRFPVEVVVFFNNAPLGDVTTLRQVSIEGIHEIRWLDPSQAQSRLAGAGHSLAGGVIQVLTATGSR